MSDDGPALDPDFTLGKDITFEQMARYVRSSGYSQLVGAELLSCAGGQATIQIPFREDLTQNHGFIHGSVIGYLADASCAWAAASVVGDCLTSEYKINLLAPGAGETFIGKGEVVKVTRRTVITRSEVFAVLDGQEKLVAIATATMMRV